MVEKGIILYDIQAGGSLTGVYTNEHVPHDGTIYTETARKTVASSVIEGDYDCFYFDEQNEPHNSLLRIARDTSNPRLLVFTWIDQASGTSVFEGFGYEMNPRQIAVHYWSI